MDALEETILSIFLVLILFVFVAWVGVNLWSVL